MLLTIFVTRMIIGFHSILNFQHDMTIDMCISSQFECLVSVQLYDCLQVVEIKTKFWYFPLHPEVFYFFLFFYFLEISIL